MNNRIEISTVIPCYNSESSITILIESLIEEFETLGLNYEIILIDDTSIDNTLEVIKELKIKLPTKNLRVFKSQNNFGQVTSTLFGVSKSTGNYILTIDDDLQHDPREFKNMYKTILNNDLDAVIAFWDADETYLRNITSSIFNFISNLIRFKSIKYRNTAFRLLNGNLKEPFLNYFIDKRWIDVRFITKKIGQIKTLHNKPHGRQFMKTNHRVKIATLYLLFDTFLIEIFLLLFALLLSNNFLLFTILLILFKLISKNRLKNNRKNLFFKSDNYVLQENNVNE